MQEKPKNFKEAALSHIPSELIVAMQKESIVTQTDLEALDRVVRKEGPKLRASIPANVQVPTQAIVETPVIPTQPASLSYAIEGHVINVPTNELGAAVVLFYTLLSLVWSKDKKIAKILKQIDFKFFDANKVQIYPKGKKK